MTIYSRLIVSCLLVATAFVIGCRHRSPEEIEATIAKSEALRRIDQICREFPHPQQFELEQKILGGNSESSSIGYQYNAHIPFEDVKAFYRDPRLRVEYNFRDEDYAEPLINEIWFRRDDVSITVENRPPSWIVNIGCSKRR